VSTNSNVQTIDDTKRDLEELKITAKNNQKLLNDMMQQARETTKLMNQVSQLQAQAVVPNQSVFPPQNQNNQQGHNHSNQFVERNTQGPQPPPKYGGQPNNQANRYPPREAKYCAYCAKTNASNPVTHNTECADSVHKVPLASNVNKPDIWHVTARKRRIPKTGYIDPQDKIPLGSLILGTGETRDHQL
jgi:hypothetical protein